MEIDTEIIQDIQNRMILHWNYRNLREIPQELLSHGQHIREIYLKRNLLTSLPEDIGRLRNLGNLYLIGNELTTLPNGIGQLISLRVLDVSQNFLPCLPSTIGQLRSLEHLLLTQNHLKSLPKELGHLHRLEFLEVSFNQLTEIPEEVIRGLESLEHFGMDGNPICYLPRGITRLPKLRYVSACKCNLLYLPNVPFHYIINRQRPPGNYTPGYAVPFGLDSGRNSSDFKFHFDSNPKLNYFPYWVIQLLGPDHDCHGCGTDNNLKDEESPCTQTRKNWRTSQSPPLRIQLDFKGRKQNLYFDPDLKKIQNDRLKEPPTLLELGLRAVYNNELLLSPINTERHSRNHPPQSISNSFTMSMTPEVGTQVSKPANGLTTDGTEVTVSEVVPDGGDPLAMVMSCPRPEIVQHPPILLPYNLNEILERGPVAKCFECMTSQFTTTRLLVFHQKSFHNEHYEQYLMWMDPQHPNHIDMDALEVRDDDIALGCLHFCGEKCLQRFRASGGTANSNFTYGSPSFVLKHEIPSWSVVK